MVLTKARRGPRIVALMLPLKCFSCLRSKYIYIYIHVYAIMMK